jgi:hypothetical protein
MEPPHEGDCSVSFGSGELVCSVTPVQPALCPGDTANFEVSVTNVGDCVVSGGQVDVSWAGCGSCSPTTVNLPALEGGQTWNTQVSCSQTSNCSNGATLSANVTASAPGVGSTNCQASVSFGAGELICSISSAAMSLCPGDPASFNVTVTNVGGCPVGGMFEANWSGCGNCAPVSLQVPQLANGQSWQQQITCNDTSSCSAGSTLSVNGTVSGPGIPTSNCQASVGFGSIGVTCTKRLTNGDSMGRLELGDTANFAVTITNTGSCAEKLDSFTDNSDCGSVDDSSCRALVGQTIPPHGTLSCSVSVNTTGCEPGRFTNKIDVGVSAGTITESSNCEAQFEVFVIPAFECYFRDIIDPVYVDGTPDNADKSSTTVLEWNYQCQRHTVYGASFRWEIPTNLKLRDGVGPQSVDIDSPHFRKEDLKFSNMSREGINYVVIELTANAPIPEGGEGWVRINVAAAQRGLATSRGWWLFKGYDEWVREDCGTTVR